MDLLNVKVSFERGNQPNHQLIQD